ncbi:hypothetical protein CLU79DRAFT_830900 [Phycomyces nitens]|nr:hypothetical protein CLU79DRAFT_830900 [Phycomyces nitens]
MSSKPSSSRPIIDRINNATREAAVVTLALSTRESERPINNRKAYLSKQRLFEDFCLSNNYENGCLVTETKLLRFLDEVVVPRGNLKKGPNPDGTVQKLKMETILRYIKAVVDLHASQASRNLSSEPSVRGKALQAWLKSRQYGERQRHRQSYRNRALHSAQDGYSPDEFIKHMMLLRRETTRDMDLADLFPLEFKDEGFSECPVLVVRIDHGKTTKFGTVQYAGTIRHCGVHTTVE